MKSVLDAVFDHAQATPDRVCVRTISQRQPGETRTFAEVTAAAGRAAAFYAAAGVVAGDVIVLIGTHAIDFYAVWLGAVWLGAIPTVMAEPSVRIDREVYSQRMDAMLGRIAAKLVAHDARVELPGMPACAQHAYQNIVASTAAVPPRREAAADDLLLLQHSSGTTGLQKGVMLSHGAVMQHAEAYRPTVGMTASDVVATWLPLYHDMGLIACFVTALIAGAEVVWLSPFEWVASPMQLLDVVTRHRATLAWLPNFAFLLLAKRMRATDSYDLSSLRAIVNCSEPVSVEAFTTFAERAAPYGFRAGALHTCFALAENTFAVTSSSDADPPRFFRIARATWQAEHRAVASTGDDAIVHVSNGRCVPGSLVRIADEAGRTLGTGNAGRVLIRSPYLFGGYFRAGEAVLDAEGFFDTGDLGYLDDAGHLYVTGRKKDIIIVGGKNVYPQDVEQVAGEVPGVRGGRVVCFGVGVRGLGTEGLVVLVESDSDESAWPDVARALRTIIPKRLDLDLVDVRVVPRGELRKSTSGKLARGGNRDWYLAGRFGEVPAMLMAGED